MSDRPKSTPPDLSRMIEATRRAVYDAVVAVHFTDPEHPAPYTPEDAGLLVFYVFGRWFATWTRLDEPANLPEHQRREVPPHVVCLLHSGARHAGASPPQQPIGR